jgi:hypothetical protein
MRRLFWLGVGVVAGASGTVWAERKVRSQLDALAPDHLVVTAGNKAKSVGRSVADAVVEGRGAMRAREDELRSTYYDAPRRPAGAPVPRQDAPGRPAATRPRGTWDRGTTRHR